MKIIASLQYLRAAGALLVLHFHIYYSLLPTFDNDDAHNLFAIGNAGVDLFFVLSGFIITKISIGLKSHSVGELAYFLIHRAIRIYPLYWLVSAFLIILFAFCPSCVNTLHRFPSYLSMLPGVLLIPNEFWTPLLVGWSLVYEVMFYLLAGIAIFFEINLTLFCLVASIFVLLNYFSSISSSTNSILLSPYTIEFTLGSIAYFVYRNGIREKTSYLFALIFICQIVYLLLYVTLPTENINVMFRVLWFGLPSFFLLSFVLSNKWIAGSNNQIFVAIGDASYSIYLVHTLVIAALIKMLDIYQYKFIELYVSLFLASLSVGVLCYYTLDKYIYIRLKFAFDQFYKSRYSS